MRIRLTKWTEEYWYPNAIDKYRFTSYQKTIDQRRSNSVPGRVPVQPSEVKSLVPDQQMNQNQNQTNQLLQQSLQPSQVDFQEADVVRNSAVVVAAATLLSLLPVTHSHALQGEVDSSFSGLAVRRRHRRHQSPTLYPCPWPHVFAVLGILAVGVRQVQSGQVQMKVMSFVGQAKCLVEQRQPRRAKLLLHDRLRCLYVGGSCHS